MKLKWRVSEKPTGSFAAFHWRGWPTCEGADEQILFAIHCEDDYTPHRVKTGAHKPLTLRVAIYNTRLQSFEWRKMKRTYATLDELKAAAQLFYAMHPEVFVNKKDA
jgi:hypothetical protein